ncbi:hypothetical protein KUTeg_023843 [Tegillarca granosa]|uniref:Uncharacterized protein n=1 Tax=Tegillarca granosa TaxID=220873 RepID=A0ABQ9E2V2_TEGGR|nr:hypothetical protein KUTeg_023843 [Tegillarca granosa]
MPYGQQYIQQPHNPFVQNTSSVYGVPSQFNHPQYQAYAHHHPVGPVDLGTALPPQGPYQHVPPEMESVSHSARTSQPSEFTNYLQQMPKGIPYPPPPENVDLSAYFQYLSTQGYPVPYPRMMPSYPPGQTYVQMTPTYNRMDSTEMFVDDKTKVLETNGQIMIPHPPAQKRDESSPRRNSRLEISNMHDGKAEMKQDVSVGEHDGRRISKQDKPMVDQDSKNPQRHIEGIRQFHEQRRLQQEEDEVLQKQRKFAKASIDRYFTSLENLYRRDYSQNEENVNNAESPSQQNKTAQIKTHGDDNGDGEETLVNTEFTSATSIKAGGVTEREEKLGIDLSFIKGEVQKSSKENVDNSNKSNGKLVIVCPECGEVNKPYMSWCADCGDVLIGVNPILMKKGKNGKLKRCITENQNVEIENIKNVTFVEKEIEGDPGIVPQIVSERDDVISPVHDEVYKGKTSPNKSDSRDSGRPSSEDMDYGRTEKEVTEICENISDPVIKGFIKAYFSRKKQAVNVKDGKDTSTGNKEEEDGEKDTNDGQPNDFEAFPPQIEIKNPTDSHATQNFNQGHSRSNVQNYVQVQSHSSTQDFVHVDSNSHESPQELETENKCDLGVIEPPVLSKTKPSYSKKKSKLKKNVPVDIEVFPSSERRSSGRSEPIVPILNLVNSSDEEDEVNEQLNQQLLDSSSEANDFSEFFDPPEEMQKLAADSQERDDNEEQPFLAQVIADINTTTKPKRPCSGNGRGKRAGNINARSIVRESIESAGYQRHWERSSIAWGSYNQRELSTKSSIRGQSARGRPSSASRNRFVRGSDENLQEEISGTSSERKPVPKKKPLNNRPASADTRRPRTAASPTKLNRRSSDTVNVHESVNVPDKESPKIQVNSPSEVDRVPDIPGIVDHRLPVEQVEDVQTKKVSTKTKNTKMGWRHQELEMENYLCGCAFQMKYFYIYYHIYLSQISQNVLKFVKPFTDWSWIYHYFKSFRNVWLF